MDTMFLVYVACLIVGGGLVLISFFSDSDHDADADVDVDVDVDVDADVDADHDVSFAHSIDGGDALWLPLLSLRFWIFFAAFFGLMGTILHLLGHTSWEATLGISAGTGLFSGWSVSWLVRKLRSERVDSNVDPERDYVGVQGEVILAIEPDSPGQVRVRVKGIDVDLSAIAEGGGTLGRGTHVRVIRYNGGTVLVEPAPSAAEAA